jgi:hypothetical protein
MRPSPVKVVPCAPIFVCASRPAEEGQVAARLPSQAMAIESMVAGRWLRRFSRRCRFRPSSPQRRLHPSNPFACFRVQFRVLAPPTTVNFQGAAGLRTLFEQPRLTLYIMKFPGNSFSFWLIGARLSRSDLQH